MRRLVQLLTASSLATLVALAACQNESEGYPCSSDNNNDDCADGLICVKPPNPNATNAPEVCCPQAGQPATTPECSVNGQIDAGNSTPPDGSTFPETSTDAHASEASTTDATTDGHVSEASTTDATTDGHVSEASTTDAPADASSTTDSGGSLGDGGPG